jgi:DNA repair exonuclease SbcCD ATPase subunit
MQDQLEKRLSELSEDFEKGTKLERLEAEAAELRHTLLRISGAIQVLQEELRKAASDSAPRGETLGPE